MPIAVMDPKGYTKAKAVIQIRPLHKSIEKYKAVFPTIITQYQDTWSPNWQAQNVYGRMDPIAFFAGTRRELTLGFRVISESLTEAEHNMRQLQRLIASQYPTYRKHAGSDVQTLKAPPYFRIKIMNIVQEAGYGALQGYFSSPITINPGFQSKQTTQYFTVDDKKLLFSDIQVSLRMVILHRGMLSINPNYPYNIHGTSSNAAATSPPQVTSGPATAVGQGSFRGEGPAPIAFSPPFNDSNRQDKSAAKLGKIFSSSQKS